MNDDDGTGVNDIPERLDPVERLRAAVRELRGWVVRLETGGFPSAGETKRMTEALMLVWGVLGLRLAGPTRPEPETVRMFPIQKSEPVPWSLAQRAYDTYAARYGTQQSLQRLAERGGFGLQEFACLFLGHEPQAQEYHPDCVARTDAVAREMAKLRDQLEVARGQYAGLEQSAQRLHGEVRDLENRQEELERLGNALADRLDSVAKKSTDGMLYGEAAAWRARIGRTP